jgi:methylated-DNA-[protein]-cysteine S-methyltransferase
MAAAKKTFSRKVYEIAAKIPAGQVLSYKEVARLAGSPRAYRAVGNILNKNHDPAVPCHRVVRSDGKTGGYNRGEGKKKEILEKERQGLLKGRK